MSFWKKLFGGGSKTSATSVAPQPSSSPTEARKCQHDWNGCKCSLCGETRNQSGLLENSLHDFRNNQCSRCGVRRRVMTTEYR
jgi:hypothetical protein